jgi:hypothetical protein
MQPISWLRFYEFEEVYLQISLSFYLFLRPVKRALNILWDKDRNDQIISDDIFVNCLFLMYVLRAPSNSGR